MINDSSYLQGEWVKIQQVISFKLKWVFPNSNCSFVEHFKLRSYLRVNPFMLLFITVIFILSLTFNTMGGGECAWVWKFECTCFLFVLYSCLVSCFQRKTPHCLWSMPVDICFLINRTTWIWKFPVWKSAQRIVLERWKENKLDDQLSLSFCRWIFHQHEQLKTQSCTRISFTANFEHWQIPLKISFFLLLLFTTIAILLLPFWNPLKMSHRSRSAGTLSSHDPTYLTISPPLTSSASSLV